MRTFLASDSLGIFRKGFWCGDFDTARNVFFARNSSALAYSPPRETRPKSQKQKHITFWHLENKGKWAKMSFEKLLRETVVTDDRCRWRRRVHEVKTNSLNEDPMVKDKTRLSPDSVTPMQ